MALRPPHRGLPGIVAATLLASGLGVVAPAASPAAAAEAEAPRAGLVAEYLFEETTGTTVHSTADGSTAGADPLDATVRQGSDNLWGGGALRLTGGAKNVGPWVELPDDLLTGDQRATISTEVRADASMLAGFHFLWNIGSDSTNAYLFSSLNCGNGRRALVGLKNGAEELVQAPTCSVAADRWMSITAVVDGVADTASLYVDGVRVASGPTTLSPADIADQSLNTIGRAPWPDPLFKGEIRSFRVWDRALGAAEVVDVSTADAGTDAADALLAGFTDRTVDGDVTLPTRGGAVTWRSADPTLVSNSGEVTQPPVGAASRSTALTATATVRGRTATRTVTYTVEPTAAPGDDYGYAMVHFIEDAQGYAEKIYLDVSRGDDPTHWLPLNDGEPILASHLGTTGVRDPYLTRNPETGTWYIIATDLRVFGGDNAGWGAWSSRGSRVLNVWESQDLIEWGPLRQVQVSPPEAGMSWAPEATWDEATGQFVVYWASTLWPASNPDRTGGNYSRILYGTTTDFTQETFDYRGAMIDQPGSDVIDTTVLQDGGTTYRLSKDNGSTAKGIYMEKTSAPDWYQPTTAWTEVQRGIGRDDFGAVEGPALFKDHDRDHWYLYVDVIPTIGYRPYETSNLGAGWTRLDTEQTGFAMRPSTKHGGIVSLTKAEHDHLTNADVDELLTQDVAVTTTAGTLPILPATAEVRLEDGDRATVPVTWDAVAPASVATPGGVIVTGTVGAIGNNLNQASGNNLGGNVATLSSTTAIDNQVTARVTVTATRGNPPVTPPVTVTPGPPIAGVPSASSLTAKVKPRKVRIGSRSTLRLRLTAASAVGSVVITVGRGAEPSWSRTVAAGTTRVRLPKQTKPGRYVVRVAWAGTAASAPVTARTTYRVTP